MAWSKTVRIGVMLAIDLGFFFLELGAGIYVGSLALMADAFHMLNDVISLVVGLWAVRVAQKATTDKFSYGWLRAEILGAFFNAVFLIALCVSILLEALTRFIDPPEIKSPFLILVVGCLGLLSNFVGFFVLGGHSHSHGNVDGSSHDGHNHSHDAGNERGHAQRHGHGHGCGDGRGADDGHHLHGHDAVREAEEGRLAATRSKGQHRRRASSGRVGKSRLPNIEDLSIHPASLRQEIIAASWPQEVSASEDSSSDDNGDEHADVGEDDAACPATERTPLMRESARSSNVGLCKGGRESNRLYEAAVGGGAETAPSRSRRARRDSTAVHIHHNHNKPRRSQKGHGHGHSHGDTGMQAMVLHVIGDALGNVGVIITALVIWKTTWPGRFYADPAVSLFITLIILRSAVPLTLATAKILLQATPDHINVNDIKADIQDLPGVVSCHHVHIWQLSDTKVVASMHVQVAFPIQEDDGERYMTLSRLARGCLHAYGIHSATIQPEFYPDASTGNPLVHDRTQPDGASSETASAYGNGGSWSDSACLLECVDNCVGQGCCSGPSSRPGSSHSPQDSVPPRAGE